MTREIPGWEPIEAGNPAAQQIVDGQWYAPEHGCDSLGKALDELVPGWISVADELPSAHETVWCFSEMWDGIQFPGWYSKYGEWFHDLDGKKMGLVTHWHPLPPPPRQEVEKETK